MRYIQVLLLIAISFKIAAQGNHRLSFDFGASASKDLSFEKSYNDNRSLFAPNFAFNYYVRLGGIHWFNTGLGYYQVGDVYEYYTGFNQEMTDVRIFVNTIKVPLLYSIFFNKRDRVNFFTKVGPSIDFVLGESVIKPKEELNSPDGFRENVSQGEVVRSKFVLLNIAAGLSFKNEKEINSYFEILYNGKVNGLYKESQYGNGVSTYNCFAVKVGVFILK